MEGVLTEEMVDLMVERAVRAHGKKGTAVDPALNVETKKEAVVGKAG